MSRRVLIVLAAFVTLVAPATAGAQDKKPVRLFAEAEDFTVTSPGWTVMPYRDNYYAGTFAVTFLSRMGCLSAPDEIDAGKKAVAEQTITIPYDDTFELLVRYEQPFQFAAEFTVEVEQGGKVVARFPCGRLTDPKIWGLNGHKRVPMHRFEWSGTDNIVWQQPGHVKLAGGAAKLRLIATEQKDGDKPRENIAKRNVDVICLTNDKAGIEAQKKTNYLEFDGWLVQDGDAFVRFTNPKDAPQPVVPVVKPFDQGQHSPYSVHVRDWPTTLVLKSGRAVSPTNYQIAGPRSTRVKAEALAPVVDAPKGAIPDAEFLQPGDTSGWVPLGNVLDSLNSSQWVPVVNAKGKSDEVYLRLEFGTPDGKGGIKVVKNITVKGPAQNLSPACFDVPGCVNPNPDLAAALINNYWLPQIRTQKEVLDWLNTEVAKFPKLGAAPKRLPIYGIMGFGGAHAAFPEAKQLGLALGDNTTFNATGKKRELVAHWGDPSLEWITKQEKSRKGGFDDLGIVSYGDEIHLPALPLTDDEFAKWLKDTGVTVEGAVKYTTDTTHPLYYYSQIAAKEKGAARYAAGTAYYKSKGVLTGANYSPHANYLVTELDYIRPFKLKAMSMPWTEDYAWQIAEFSPQIVGYLVSGLRAGAKYDDLPIHMYVMPHSPGQVPNEFRLSYYASLAHGAKMINYFCATPSAVGATENYVDSYDLPMWKQIYTCTREAGIFEDYVVDGKVRPAKVGLLLSSTDEVITRVNNFSLALHNNERKALYYALRHAQVPVDFLSEDDVIEGRARGYSLIYVTQQYVHSKCLDALQKWCEAGGTAVAMVGGGFQNEFQKENPAAAKFYGASAGKIVADPNLVSKYLTRENVPFLSKHDLPRYEPMDAVQWCLRGLPKKEPDPNPVPEHIFNVPVIAWKQALAPTDGTVIGKFKDGAPAVVSKPHGRGRAVLFGFLPGQAYLKSGLPVRPVDRGASAESYAHYLPTSMNLVLLSRLTDDFLGRDVREAKPVVTTDGLVETTCIDTPAKDGKPARLAVPLVNWSGAELTSLTITVRGVDAASKVRSVERGELKFTQLKGGIQITMPLNVADMLLIDK
ncbi:type 1 glutamine amidotransferase family protein [Frigoriglobus tundricola]|uniref:Beta-galactosidase trimerisation domain-containing protein n=1 Tax=Frigoriglobus tundricola TaxID=2774151 RepID=A0A6M5YPE8_9BACT|nr:hypothetical protein [Frigoriglobus tundricola]QJW95226.1 hypothetical protein FTUN_2768 [Frigoriglobus tundricola]